MRTMNNLTTCYMYFTAPNDMYTRALFIYIFVYM